MGRHSPLKIALRMAESGLLRKTCFFGPIRVHNPIGISIGLAVFAGLTIVTDRPTDRQTSWWVLRTDCAPSSERPQFRIPAVRNAPKVRSQHDAAPPVQLQYPGERRAAAAVPLPESP